MLFTHNHLILALTPGALHLYTVTLSSAENTIDEVASSTCTIQTAPQAVTKLLAKLSSVPSSVRLLLSDEYAYILDVAVSKNVSPQQERIEVQRAAETIIPEELEKVSWDYKIQQDTKQTLTATVFVPVVRIYKPLESVITQAGIALEAVETFQLASARHENPLIGLALKSDITGKDALVLNLQAKADFKEPTSVPTPEEAVQSHLDTSLKTPLVPKPLLSRWFAVLLLVVVAATAALVYFLGSSAEAGINFSFF